MSCDHSRKELWEVWGLGAGARGVCVWGEGGCRFLSQTIMTRLPVLFLRKADASGTFESLKAKGLGCGAWTMVPIQLLQRGPRWPSC